MESFSYPVTLVKDKRDGGYAVTFKDIPEAITQGEDLDDALSQAADCLEEAIAGRIRRNEDLPEPTRGKRGDYLVPVPAATAAKAALYLAIRESQITKVELAKRLGCDEKEVRRLLDPRHASKIERIQAALAVLGKQLVVGVRAA